MPVVIDDQEVSIHGQFLALVVLSLTKIAYHLTADYARRDRYVIAAVEYVSRFAVARDVPSHTAENIAKFVMHKIVIRHGAFRELLTDGAPKMVGRGIQTLATMLQFRQTDPVPIGQTSWVSSKDSIALGRTWSEFTQTMSIVIGTTGSLTQCLLTIALVIRQRR